MRTFSHGFTIYWQIWALVTFVGFIVPEVYALVTNANNTLSDNVWRAEKFLPGQAVVNWSAFHFLFIALLLLLDVWLLGHFGWGLWR